ncbi:glycosyltransferase [Eubacteriales bacterium OttesenSCG-928-M02]|nr:glycosyltransferase [Eubacteriales bacterium OttesenSCG-928-M02]
MKHIIYAARLCSQQQFDAFFETANVTVSQQAQKYHRLLVEGFAQNSIDVQVVGILPVSREITDKCYVKGGVEQDNGVSYNVIGLVNIPIIKNLFLALASFFRTWRLIKDRKHTVVFCDVLNISLSFGALLAAKIKRVQCIGVVTDVPGHMSNRQNRLFVAINNAIIHAFSAYLFLTQQMSNVVNKNNKPYIVIEGQVDINMSQVQNMPEVKYFPRVCIYAGGVEESYGLGLLCEAFVQLDMPDVVLRIYGDGDYVERLQRLSAQHGNIEYMGIVKNDDVIIEQLRATLLINPRPTHHVFTQYSFPSKNLEYMASGTPVLTTRLPGMPSEYYPYVFLFEEESVDGYAKTLQNVLSNSNEVLHEHGRLAKQFVMEAKNNVFQVAKIIKWIDERIV